MQRELDFIARAGGSQRDANLIETDVLIEHLRLTYTSADVNSIRRTAIDLLARFFAFALAGTASLAVTLNVFVESFHTARLSIVLAAILTLQVLQCRRFLFCREYALYFAFVVYLFIAVLWTPDITLALNTLVPAVNFMLILVLFGVLATFYDYRAVVAGTLVGFVVGAGLYSLTVGFPFVRPIDFSYNAIAGMYLFGLFVTLLAASCLRPKRILLGLALIVLLLVIATMSIKNNLGILLAIGATGLFYFRYVAAVIGRNALLLVVAVAGMALTFGSSEAILQTLKVGLDRIVLGVEILQAGENLPGYSAFDNRIAWLVDGFLGWMQRPVFGHGVEAFRDRYDITSHSAPIDLLYNYGLIGFSLFYAVFVSIGMRLRDVRDVRFRQLTALIFGTSICYLFVSLSSTNFYNAFVAVFIAFSGAVLHKIRLLQESASTGALTQ